MFDGLLQALQTTLHNFDIDCHVVDYVVGPRTVCYNVRLGRGVRVKQIQGLETDLAIGMQLTEPIRIITQPRGSDCIGVEVPHNNFAPVLFNDLKLDRAFVEHKGALPILLGKDTSNETVVADLAAMPHLLIAGTTGSGKSIVLHSIINSLLFVPNVQLVLIDPKQTEFAQYQTCPTLYRPLARNVEEAIAVLEMLVDEMDRRYGILAQSNKRSVKETDLPYIVVVVDELADLLLSNKKQQIEKSIVRLANKSRAAGIHLVLATQRPTVDVITGNIKANISHRIALRVATRIDSKVILDGEGAEQLLGTGDMLYSPGSVDRALRVQGTYVSSDEIVLRVKALQKTTSEAQAKPCYFTRESPISDLIAAIRQGKLKGTATEISKCGLDLTESTYLVRVLKEQRIIDAQGRCLDVVFPDLPGLLQTPDAAKPANVISLKDWRTKWQLPDWIKTS